jgi:hypothetical protein
MPWRAPNSYDDWDEICTALFKSFVLSALTYSYECRLIKPLPPYDMAIPTYKEHSFICEASNTTAALIRFESKDQPFDTGVYAVLDASSVPVEDICVPLDRSRFVLAGRDSNGLTLHDRITVEL